MIYLLDGYNILFFFLEEKKDFRNQRQELVHYFQKRFADLEFSGILVFDGSHRREEDSGRAYKSPLDILYTPKGQSADAFIIEKIELAENPKDITVVTLDGGLARQARAMQARVQKPAEFIRFLQKKGNKPKKEKTATESPKNIDRLLKIFEDKLRHEDVSE